MNPFAKIFYLMSTTSKEYVKLLKEHDYPGRVLRLIDSAEASSTVKQPLRPLPSEFGECAGWEEPLKDEIVDFNFLLHSLEVFDISYDSVKKWCSNRAKPARISLGRLIARTGKGRDYFEKNLQVVLYN